MIVLRRQKETPPTYPVIPDTPTGVDADAVWQRIEQWIAYRWPVREVEWIVMGNGEFQPPLAECDIIQVERSEGAGWAVVSDPIYSPLGVVLTGAYHRVTANVGSDDDPPAAVAEAFRRLAQYLADVNKPGLSSHTATVGDLSEHRTMNAAAAARAIHYSGAGDLLRPWRHA